MTIKTDSDSPKTPSNFRGIEEHNEPHASELAARYAAVDRAAVYPDMYRTFQAAADEDQFLRILDIGSGSGDDAIAFARMGHRVTAIEPSDLRLIAEGKHAHKHVIYINDTLPDLHSLKGQNQFDAVNMSAVLQYIHPDDRVLSLANICRRMKAGARMYVSYPSPPSRPHQYELSLKDLFNIGRAANKICAERLCPPLLINGTPSSIPDSTGRKSIDGRDVVFHNVVFQKSYNVGPV